MKTIKRVLATTIVLAIIGATPVFCCDWGFCDREYVDNANSLLGLTCDRDKCFRSLGDELSALCNLYGSPLRNLFGQSCCYHETRCGQRFRQDLKELVGILNRMPGVLGTISLDAKAICRLICRHSEACPDCHEDYLKDTRKLMKLVSLKQAGITLLGAFNATKERHKGVTNNRLLDILSEADPDRFVTVRMALATGQLRNAAEMSNTSLLMLASAMGDLQVVREVLGKRENVNARNETGKTAVMFAASEGQPEVVETLLKAGADPDLKDEEGDTAASMAKKKGHYDVLKILEQASVKKQDRLSD